MSPMSPRLLRPRATGFNPASISGIANWWDGNDFAPTHGAVETWTSKAGSKSAATQTTANNRPTTTTVNGKTALLFNGTSAGLNFTGTARTDETWFIVAAQTADQSGIRALLNDGGNGDGVYFAKSSVKLLESAWTTGIAGGSTDGVARLRVQATPNLNDAFPASVIANTRASAGGGQLFINGTAQASAINGSTSMTNSGSVTIQRIGYYSSTPWPFGGWISEILCYSRALSASERQRVERYLGRKWGSTVA
jgi:hypothetical protein